MVYLVNPRTFSSLSGSTVRIDTIMFGRYNAKKRGEHYFVSDILCPIDSLCKYYFTAQCREIREAF